MKKLNIVTRSQYHTSDNPISLILSLKEFEVAGVYHTAGRSNIQFREFIVKKDTDSNIEFGLMASIRCDEAVSADLTITRIYSNKRHDLNSKLLDRKIKITFK